VAVAVEAVEQFTRRAMVDLEVERLITQVSQRLVGLEHLVKVTLEEAFKRELPHRAKAAVAAVDRAAQVAMSIAA
jgi:type IV secretory pathway VirD2 relaxase